MALPTRWTVDYGCTLFCYEANGGRTSFPRTESGYWQQDGRWHCDPSGCSTVRSSTLRRGSVIRRGTGTCGGSVSCGR